MTKFAKFISKDCAAGAPDFKNGQAYTEEMAKADGFLPIIEGECPNNIKRPKIQYKIENDTIISYYIESPEDEEESFIEDKYVESEN